MKSVAAGVLEVAYLEQGPADGPPVILLHGFPYDVHSYEYVAAQLSQQGFRCLIPYLRGYGPTRFLSKDTPRSGQQAALGHDLRAFLDALEIPQAILAGYDWGGRAACVVAALWPERARGLISCGTGYNIQDIATAASPAEPKQERRFWYQYYFHSERGRAGLATNRHALARLLWELWSPTWSFGEETFNRSASAFDNPDFVEVVIHSYRHRYGLVSGDPALDSLEEKLARQPAISVPTIVLEGADDDVDPWEERDHHAAHFTGHYERRVLPRTGHNPPQESPDAFAQAVLDLAEPR
ncbi:alpha/beta fold hydrolase [Fodinicurvata sediminis]|uniref:alpha/beta fold hydrolase n=1 Tax=Fodinicurvata sediminis TaxID=1121832 RepID=UPI0003B4B80C|nr:alpha/beta hydrolase [Fodinicurvata sediminis]